MNQFTTVCFVLMLLFSALNLAVSLSIGFAAADNRRGGASSPPQRAKRRRIDYQAGFERLLKQVAEVSSLYHTQNRPVSHTLTQAIEELLRTSKALQKQINKGSKHEAAPRRPIQLLGYDLGGPEFSALITTTSESKDEVLAPNRRRYSIKQLMAPCVHDRLPEPEAFETVQCQEVWVGGISFYADNVPVAQELVITLGREEDRMYVLAEVTARRMVQLSGEPTYLNNCRFKRRLGSAEDETQVAKYRQRLVKEPVVA